MKNREKNGFTLIELLVIIAMIAAISVGAEVGMITIRNNTELEKNKQAFKDIIKAVDVYCHLRNNEQSCSSAITLDSVIQKGLLDESVINNEYCVKLDDKTVLTTGSLNVTFNQNQVSVSGLNMDNIDGDGVSLCD